MISTLISNFKKAEINISNIFLREFIERCWDGRISHLDNNFDTSWLFQ